MSEQRHAGGGASTAILNGSAVLWFITAAIGQWIFLSYVVAVYGGAAVEGDLSEWNKHLSGAYVPGETMGNIAAAMHLLLAVVILGGGPLQLIPQIRNRFPVFHHWVGRSYMLATVTTAIVGLYMLFVRDIGGVSLKVGFVLQAVFIVVFAAMALRYAMARKIDIHYRWAMRLFLAASAVWFFRVILMIWVLFTGGAGIDFSTGKGPFLDFMSFGQYLPLVVFEVYWRTKERGRAGGKLAMAAFLVFAAFATAAGVFLATVGMWFPQS